MLSEINIPGFNNLCSPLRKVLSWFNESIFWQSPLALPCLRNVFPCEPIFGCIWILCFSSIDWHLLMVKGGCLWPPGWSSLLYEDSFLPEPCLYMRCCLGFFSEIRNPRSATWAGWKLRTAAWLWFLPWSWPPRSKSLLWWSTKELLDSSDDVHDVLRGSDEDVDPDL